jgi:predicted DNA-binding protein YlxM (UPF0122 family)
MATKKQKEQRWQQLRAETLRINREQTLGISVGEAAAELGISRQAVHKAIVRGDLGSITVNDYEGQPRMRFIPMAQVEAFKARREKRPS